jgi:hypothetical protein
MSVIGSVSDMIAKGYVVFPLAPDSKIPRIQWASNDLPAVENWPADTTSYGIDCGKSGLVVIDIDGEQGCNSFDELLDNYGLRAWPDTFTIKTQSGGYHLYFTATGYRNSASKIADHVDIRGDGGYVVGAGSVVNGKTYTIESDAKVLRLPWWLTFALKPDDDGYYLKTLNDLVAEVESAEQGTRNDTLNRIAFVAYMNDRIDDDEASQALHSAALAVGLSDHETSRTLQSALGAAQRQQAARGAGDTSQALTVPHRVSERPTSPGAAVRPTGAADQLATVDYDVAVANEVLKLQIRDKARAEYYGRNNPYPETCSTDDIENSPDAEWLIDGVLERGVVAFVVGFTGTAKSFVVADWSMSVATGKNWLGHSTSEDPVLYIAAEGGRTHKKRVMAWKRHHRKNHTGHLAWKTQPVQIMNDLHFEALLREVRAANYRLVVIDTLSRCFVGFNQKDDLDIGKLYDRLQKLRDAVEPYGTTVIVIHHTGWSDKTRSRGSSDLPSSADAEYVLTSDDILQGAQLECTKMKDENAHWRINLRLEKIELGTDAKGRPVSSLVVVDGPDELMVSTSDDPRKRDLAWRRNFLSSYEWEDRTYTVGEIVQIMNTKRGKNDQASEWSVRQDLKAMDVETSKGPRNATMYRFSL